MKKTTIYLITDVIVIFIMVLLFMGSTVWWYEYINVGVLKNTYGYPWGHYDSGPNYASPEIYSKSALKEAIIFTIIPLILLLSLIMKKNYIKVIGILILIITIVIGHLN